MIRRRELVALLGGAAAAWPLAARAQQPERMRRIGVLMNAVSDDAEGQARLAAFHQGLQQLGWTVGHNVGIDYRWGSDDAERGRRGAAELVALGTSSWHQEPRAWRHCNSRPALSPSYL
jgi:putative ABC transport system substrate-binding protein